MLSITDLERNNISWLCAVLSLCSCCSKLSLAPGLPFRSQTVKPQPNPATLEQNDIIFSVSGAEELNLESSTDSDLKNVKWAHLPPGSQSSRVFPGRGYSKLGRA